MLRGLATISYWADDVKAARAWYTELLGITPYFQQPDAENPAYVEFRLGDYQHELGIIDRRYAPSGMAAEPGGVVAYWHVDDVAAALQRLIELGATVHEPLTPRGHGWITGSVIDPFGNILGVIYNPLYLEVLAGHGTA